MVRPATSLGRSGLHDWLIQRLSAVVLLGYVLLMAAFFVRHPEGVDYYWWQAFMDRPLVKIATLLALVSVVAHAWIGLWTVFTDYVKPVALRFVLQSGLMISCLAMLLWGFVTVWGV